MMCMGLDRIDRVLLSYPLILSGAAVVALIGFAVLSSLTSSAASFSLTELVWWSPSHRQVGWFIAFILLGNIAHNFFSFWALVRVPELRKWAAEYRWGRLGIWQVLVLFFGLSLLMSMALPPQFSFLRPQAADLSLPVILIVAIFVTLNAHHNMSQLKGIGFVLSFRDGQQRGMDASREPAIESLHRREIWMYRILTVEASVFLTLYIAKIWTPGRDYFVIRTIILIAIYAWVTQAILKLPASLKAWRLLYSVRLVPRLIVGFHPLATLLMSSFHSLDAALVYYRMAKQSQSGKTLKREFIFVYLTFSALAAALVYSEPLVTETGVRQLLHAGFIAALLSHYFFEGIQFRMRNPITRRHVAPLLHPPTSPRLGSS